MKHLILVLSLVSQLSFGRVANDFYRMPFTGNVPGWGPITPLNLPVLNRVETGAINQSQPGSINAWTNLTGGSVSLTTSGRAVEVTFEPSNSVEGAPDTGNFLFGSIGCSNSGTAPVPTACAFGLNVNGVPSGTHAMRNTTAGNPTGNLIALPCSSFKWVVTPAAGVNTFQIRWAGSFISGTTFSTVSMSRCKLTATEL